LKLSLICSAALVSIVPLICTTKVMKQARIVTRHFFDCGQLKGLSGSEGPFQSMIWYCEFDAWEVWRGCDVGVASDEGSGGFSLEGCESSLGVDIAMTM
jgi:hypothetical protein